MRWLPGASYLQNLMAAFLHFSLMLPPPKVSCHHVAGDSIN
jgi:hypothetical protein